MTATDLSAVNSVADLAAAFDIDAATIERLGTYDRLLLETSSHTNLIARRSLDERWTRHYTDSAQLLPFLPSRGASVLDIGSGAGFPALVLAILDPSRTYTLVESVGKKAAFLRAVAEEVGLENAKVLPVRAESLYAAGRRFDIVTARAVSALPRLLELAIPLVAKDGSCIFPKGERGEDELADARRDWAFSVERHPSRTRAGAEIFILSEIRKRT